MSRPIVLTGGGTAGHVFPLRAVAEALLGAGVARDELVVVGSRRGQEGTLLADLGVEVVLLPGRGLRRSASPRAIAQNVGAVFGLLSALAEAEVRIARLRPRAVVSVGGYAAFAASVGAVSTGRPLILVDLDATPGLVHRTLRPFAVAVTTAFPTEGSTRSVVTGVPLRADVVAVERTGEHRRAACARLGLDPSSQVVAVMTGSLGAGSVNSAVCGLAERWRGRSTATLYHVAGSRDLEMVKDAKARTGIGDDRWRVVGFETAAADVWTACDVAVCRAGATTVAELCVTGVPSVLVPLPGSPGAHQDANASVLERIGAAVVVDDASISAELLDSTLSALLDDPARLTAMATAARSLARADAASRVAAVVLDHAR